MPILTPNTAKLILSSFNAFTSFKRNFVRLKTNNKAASMEIGAYSSFMYWQSLRRSARSLPFITFRSLQFLMLVDEIAKQSNCSFVDKKVLVHISGYADMNVYDCIKPLVVAGYLKQRGGRCAPTINGKSNAPFNRASYCLTGKGNSLIVQFNIKYAELLAKPMPVTFGRGWPKGKKRDGERGKMIRDE